MLTLNPRILLPLLYSFSFDVTKAYTLTYTLSLSLSLSLSLFPSTLTILSLYLKFTTYIIPRNSNLNI